MKVFPLLFFATLLYTNRRTFAGEECNVDLTDPTSVRGNLEDGLTVTCTATMMEISISSCVFEAMGYNGSNDLVLNGPNGNHVGPKDEDCKGNWLEDAHTVSWAIGLDDCDTEVVTGDETRVYSNAIRTVEFSNIMDCVVAYRTDIQVNVSCDYDYHINDTVGVFEPEIVPLTDVSAMGSGEYGENVTLCYDSDCEEEIQDNDSVEVLALVYVVIHVKLESLVVQIVNIWATPNADPNDAISYDFMVSGCPKRDIFDIDHYSGFWAWFCFPAFHWVDDKLWAVYIHIEYMLCDQDASDDCMTGPSCDRKRRDVTRLTAVEKREIRTKTIGPFRVRQ